MIFVIYFTVLIYAVFFIPQTFFVKKHTFNKNNKKKVQINLKIERVMVEPFGVLLLKITSNFQEESFSLIISILSKFKEQTDTSFQNDKNMFLCPCVDIFTALAFMLILSKIKFLRISVVSA